MAGFPSDITDILFDKNKIIDKIKVNFFKIIFIIIIFDFFKKNNSQDQFLLIMPQIHQTYLNISTKNARKKKFQL